MTVSFRNTDLLFARMPRTYNEDILAAEAARIAANPDQARSQEQRGVAAEMTNKLRRGATEYHTGGWLLTCDMMSQENQKMLPYCHFIMNDLPAKVVRARILGLMPGHKIRPHVGNLEEREIARFHVPLVTHPAARLFAVDESIHIPVGQLWYLNQTRTHWVENNSDILRLHLVVDLEPTERLAAWFAKALIRVTKPRLGTEE